MTTNAIAISRDLAAAGFQQKQADAIAEAVVTHSDDSLVTKADMVKSEGDLKSDIANLKIELKTDFARLDGKIDAINTKLSVMGGVAIILFSSILVTLLTQ